MPKGYREFIAKKINEFPEGIPIFTDDVSDLVAKEFLIDKKHAQGIVNTNLNRINGKAILNYKKGIYYKPKTTIFGKTKLNPMQVVTKMYLSDDNVVFGYETGASLFQNIGLTTQVPKYRYFATNKYRQRGSRIIEDMNVVIRKPNTEVNNDNCLYLQLIDAIENKDGIIVDANNPIQILNDYINKNKLDYGKIIAIASLNYSKEVLLRITDLAVKTRL